MKNIKKSLVRAILKVGACVLLCWGAGGCDGPPGFSELRMAAKGLDQAAREVGKLRALLEIELPRWRELVAKENSKWYELTAKELPAWRKETREMRETLAKMPAELRSAAREVITNDLTLLVGALADDSAVTAFAIIEFAEKRLLRHLRSLEGALLAKRKELEETGKLDGPAADVIKAVVDGAGEVEPFVYKHVPKTVGQNVDVVYTNSWGTPAAFEFTTKHLHYLGFHLAGRRKTDFSLMLVGEDGKTRNVVGAEKLLVVQPYAVEVHPASLARSIREGDVCLVLGYKGTALYEHLLAFGQPPAKPADPPATPTPMPIEPPREPVPAEGKWLFVSSARTGHYLDVGELKEGGDVIQNPKTPGRVWRLTKSERHPGYFYVEFKSDAPARFLDVAGRNRDDPGRICVASRDPDQVWKFVATEDGYWRLQSWFTGMNLDVLDGKLNPGARICQSSSSDPKQVWRFDPAD